MGQVIPFKPAEARATVEPSTRTYRLWTVDLLRAAEAQADAGNLRLAAEMCDALLGDDRIPALLQTRSQALFGLVPTFEASGDGRRKNKAVKALEAGEDWWSLCNEADAAQIFEWGHLLGLCPAELCWYDDQGKALTRDGRNVPQLRFRHPKHLRYDTLQRQWLIAVGDAGQEVPFTPGDGHWFLFAPYGANRPWSRGAWRGLGRWWLLKLYAIHDWGEHSEKGSALFVESPEGSTREQRKELASDLYELASQGVVTLPPGFKASLLEIAANTQQIYDAQKEAADVAFAIRLLGHNLTSKVDGGSYAAAQVGDSVRLDLRKFDATAWGTATHDQALTHWARVNFGDPGLAPWPLYPVEPPEDLKAKGEGLEKLGTGLSLVTSALDPLGLELNPKSVTELVAKAGLDTREKAPAPKAAPTSPPAPPPATVPPPTPSGEQDEPPPSQPAAKASRVALGSAADARQIAAEGTIWSDRLADEATRQGTEAMGRHVESVLAALEQARGYDDLKARLLSLVDGQSPHFERLVYRALILCTGRGAASVADESTT